jgi:putative tryptophan/tyrosine transport system substrate-binding protein
MRRRDFIAGLGGVAAASSAIWPLAARAQQPAMPAIGYLSGGSASPDFAAGFRSGMAETGFVEGRNLTIEFRPADYRYDRLPGLVADLISRKVAVIAASGAAPAVAAKAATSTIPIVFFMGEDPVALGLVTSFNRPGGNVTGVAFLSSTVMAKRLEQLHELVPQATVVAALVNPKNPNAEISTKDAQDAARGLGLQIHILKASTADELDGVFATLAQLKAGALLIAPDGVFIAGANQIAVLSARYGIPASHEFRAFPAAGGLISYGSSARDGSRLAGIYVGRILKGEKPADLPVVQPTQFELVINLKTARGLGITVPQTLLVAATEVIE